MGTTWGEGAKKKQYPKFGGSERADVVIIGGGMAGILNAYFLSTHGKKVILLERDEIGSGATLMTTAFITKVIDTDVSKIVKLFGQDGAKLVWSSGQAAIEAFDTLIQAEHISCEFVRCPDFDFASTKKQFEVLAKEREEYEKLGIKTALHEDGSALGFKNAGYLEFPDQAKFDPAHFLFAVAALAEKHGARIFEHSEVVELSEKGQPITAKTANGNVTADEVIISTYQPLTNKKMHLKKGMYRSYIFDLEIPKDSFREAIYENESNPYNYFRIDRRGNYDRMVVGGEDHKDIFGDTLVEKSFASLERFVQRTFPGLEYTIKNKWNGPILEPSDGLPLIGRIMPGYYVATAFSGNGMTYSMISALMLSDLILGKSSTWESIYDPTRAMRPKRLASKAADYIEEFFRGAAESLLGK